MVYADLLRPTMRRSALLYDAALVLGASLVIALSAQVAIQLPFSPVPITGQTMAVLLVGALLGSRRGALAVLAYIAEGLAGLPVFAGGAAGLARLFGPTGGYLVGFVAAAFLVGWLAERGWDRRFGTTLAAMTLGNLVIYGVGAVWLAVFVGGLSRAWSLGVLPFLPGDAIKIILAAVLLPGGWKLLGMRGQHPAYLISTSPHTTLSPPSGSPTTSRYRPGGVIGLRFTSLSTRTTSPGIQREVGHMWIASLLRSSPSPHTCPTASTRRTCGKTSTGRASSTVQ